MDSKPPVQASTTRAGDAPAERARLAVSAIFFLCGILTGGWVPHIPLVKEPLGVGTGVFGWLLLALAAGGVTAMPVTGALINRFGSAALCRISGILMCPASRCRSTPRAPDARGGAFRVRGRARRPRRRHERSRRRGRAAPEARRDVVVPRLVQRWSRGRCRPRRACGRRRRGDRPRGPDRRGIPRPPRRLASSFSRPRSIAACRIRTSPGRPPRPSASAPSRSSRS